jgi:hypothetical protein
LLERRSLHGKPPAPREDFPVFPITTRCVRAPGRRCCLLILAALLVLGPFGAGCQGVNLPGSKLDAEELGWQEEHGGTLTSSSNQAYQLCNASEDVAKFAKLGDANQRRVAETQMVTSLRSLQELAKQQLPRLDQTLAPEAMTDIQAKMVAYLRQAEQARTPQDLVPSSLDYYKAANGLKAQLDARPVQPGSAAPHNLQIEIPIDHPFFQGVGADFSTGIFYVRTPLKVPEGLVPRQQSQGVNRLVIRVAGKERYFSLSRPFTIYLPSRFGVNIDNLNAKSGQLVIEVVSVEKVAVGGDSPRGQAELKADENLGTVIVQNSTPVKAGVGAFLHIDGVSVKRWPTGVGALGVQIPAGPHTLEIRTEKPAKRVVARFTVTVVAGKEQTVAMNK